MLKAQGRLIRSLQFLKNIATRRSNSAIDPTRPSQLASCKLNSHRLQNAGVVLNRRHLLRSVFATAIRSRACQPATAPIAS